MILRDLGRCAALTALLAVLLIHHGCASVTSNDAGSGLTADSSGGTVPTSTVIPDAAQTLTFEATPLTVSVLSQSTVNVRVWPASAQTVTFALVGNSLDASLEVAQVSSDASGLASVTLTAPSSITTFTIRASIDHSTVTEATVRVVAAATGALNVSAKYSGTRQVSTYSIRVFPNEDCASADLNASASKPLSLTTSTLPIAVDGIPLGTPLAVIIDGDQTTVHGCAALRGVTSSTPLAVEVPLEDLALNPSGQSLEVAMTTVDGLLALQDSLRESIPTLVGTLVLGNHDLTDLLQTMETTAPGSLQQEFGSLRSASNWDSLVVSAYGSVGGIDLLRRQFREWLSQGIALLSRQPTFEIQLTLGPKDYKTPQLTPLRIAGLDAATRLSMQSSDLALSIEAGDRLNWSSTLSFNKATLIGALTYNAASAEYSEGSSIPDQLGMKLDCDTFGATLDQNSVWSNANSRVCTAACLATLCRSALSAMYQRAIAAAFGVPTTPLFISASGKVVVDAQGQPVATDGTWIGFWSTETAAVTLSGTYASQ